MGVVVPRRSTWCLGYAESRERQLKLYAVAVSAQSRRCLPKPVRPGTSGIGREASVMRWRWRQVRRAGNAGVAAPSRSRMRRQSHRWALLLLGIALGAGSPALAEGIFNQDTTPPPIQVKP